MCVYILVERPITVNMLINEAFSFTGVTILYTLLVFSFFVIGLTAFVTGYRKRRRLTENYRLIPAKVTQRKGVKAHLEWAYQGEIYASSPMRFYALRRGEHVNIFIQYDTGMIEGIDIWSENGRAYYFVTIACWVLAGATLVFATQL